MRVRIVRTVTRPSAFMMQARNSQLPTCRPMFEDKREAIMAIEAVVLPLMQPA
jgi:hypothetical protein